MSMISIFFGELIFWKNQNPNGHYKKIKNPSFNQEQKN